MANLTGEYDVATELSLGLVNCVVAAIHENENENYPRLLHSLTVRVDDRYRGAGDPVPQAERTGIRTTAEVQVSTPTVSFPERGLADPIWSRTRSHVSAAIRPGWGPIGPGAGSTCWPLIGVRVRLRAWLRDAPEALPEFLHGDVHLTAGLVREDVAGVGTILKFDYSSGPDVRFEPAAGTTLSDGQRAVAGRILRNYVRSDSEPVSFGLDRPQEVDRFDYKLLPSGPRPSAMLMFTLGDGSPGSQGPGSVSARFLPSGADFAVAIGRDYLLGIVRKGFLSGLPSEYTSSGTGYKVRIRPDWTGATLDLEPGRIRFTVRGAGGITYGAWRFTTTDDFTFTIRVAIALHVVGGTLQPVLADDPEVDLHDIFVFEGTIEGIARDRIKAEVQNALDAALEPAPDGTPSELRRALDVGKPLEEIIGKLHPSPAGVAVTGVEIRPDGVVVPGTVALSPSRPVQVKRTGLNGHSDALESWIPGGTIERFEWGTRVEEHRFVTEKPLAAIEPRGCLTVSGTRVTRGGGLVSVSAEDCPVLVATLPVMSGLPTPLAPCRRPLLPLLGPTLEGRMEVVGHYDPWASGLVPSAGPTNLLVHFAEGDWAEAEAVLGKALAATDRRDAAIVVVGVLGAGELAQLSDTTMDSDATLHLTEDPAGSWAAAFGTGEAPATVLVGPDGHERWRDEGKLDPAGLGRVLDEQLEVGGEVSWRALQLAVAETDEAPDVPLQLGEGSAVPLRRLRGASAVLSFWTSCSEPSIEQLRQLREALDSRRKNHPNVLGIGDGESAEQVAELAKRERLPFPLVPDPERVIARQLGVSSWPATVQVRPDGRVEAVDLGLVPGVSPCDRPDVIGVYSTGGWAPE